MPPRQGNIGKRSRDEIEAGRGPQNAAENHWMRRMINSGRIPAQRASELFPGTVVDPPPAHAIAGQAPHAPLTQTPAAQAHTPVSLPAAPPAVAATGDAARRPSYAAVLQAPVPTVSIARPAEPVRSALPQDITRIKVPQVTVTQAVDNQELQNAAASHTIPTTSLASSDYRQQQTVSVPQTAPVASVVQLPTPQSMPAVSARGRGSIRRSRPLRARPSYEDIMSASTWRAPITETSTSLRRRAVSPPDEGQMPRQQPRPSRIDNSSPSRGPAAKQSSSQIDLMDLDDLQPPSSPPVGTFTGTELPFSMFPGSSGLAEDNASLTIDPQALHPFGQPTVAVDEWYKSDLPFGAHRPSSPLFMSHADLPTSLRGVAPKMHMPPHEALDSYLSQVLSDVHISEPAAAPSSPRDASVSFPVTGAPLPDGDDPSSSSSEDESSDVDSIGDIDHILDSSIAGDFHPDEEHLDVGDLVFDDGDYGMAAEPAPGVHDTGVIDLTADDSAATITPVAGELEYPYAQQWRQFHQDRYDDNAFSPLFIALFTRYEELLGRSPYTYSGFTAQPEFNGHQLPSLTELHQFIPDQSGTGSWGSDDLIDRLVHSLIQHPAQPDESGVYIISPMELQGLLHFDINPNIKEALANVRHLNSLNPYALRLLGMNKPVDSTTILASHNKGGSHWVNIEVEHDIQKLGSVIVHDSMLGSGLSEDMKEWLLDLAELSKEPFTSWEDVQFHPDRVFANTRCPQQGDASSCAFFTLQMHQHIKSARTTALIHDARQLRIHLLQQFVQYVCGPEQAVDSTAGMDCRHLTRLMPSRPSMVEENLYQRQEQAHLRGDPIDTITRQVIDPLLDGQTGALPIFQQVITPVPVRSRLDATTQLPSSDSASLLFSRRKGVRKVTLDALLNGSAWRYDLDPVHDMVIMLRASLHSTNKSLKELLTELVPRYADLSRKEVKSLVLGLLNHSTRDFQQINEQYGAKSKRAVWRCIPNTFRAATATDVVGFNQPGLKESLGCLDDDLDRYEGFTLMVAVIRHSWAQRKGKYATESDAESIVRLHYRSFSPNIRFPTRAGPASGLRAQAEAMGVLWVPYLPNPISSRMEMLSNVKDVFTTEITQYFDAADEIGRLRGSPVNVLLLGSGHDALTTDNSTWNTLLTQYPNLNMSITLVTTHSRDFGGSLARLDSRINGFAWWHSYDIRYLARLSRTESTLRLPPLDVLTRTITTYIKPHVPDMSADTALYDLLQYIPEELTACRDAVQATHLFMTQEVTLRNLWRLYSHGAFLVNLDIVQAFKLSLAVVSKKFGLESRIVAYNINRLGSRMVSPGGRSFAFEEDMDLVRRCEVDKDSTVDVMHRDQQNLSVTLVCADHSEVAQGARHPLDIAATFTAAHKERTKIKDAKSYAKRKELIAADETGQLAAANKEKWKIKSAKQRAKKKELIAADETGQLAAANKEKWKINSAKAYAKKKELIAADETGQLAAAEKEKNKIRDAKHRAKKKELIAADETGQLAAAQKEKKKIASAKERAKKKEEKTKSLERLTASDDASDAEADAEFFELEEQRRKTMQDAIAQALTASKKASDHPEADTDEEHLQ